MRFKSNAFRLVLSFCLIFCLSFAAFADTIRLKDGSVIKGKIVGFSNGQFLVQIGDGARLRQMTFFADEIDAIEFDSSGAAANQGNEPSTNPTSAVLPKPSGTSNQQTASKTESGKVVNQGDGIKPNNSQTSSPNSTPANTPAETNRPANTSSNAAVNTPISTRPKPIQLNLKVLADNTANGWTNAGWVVKKGQRIKITGTGRISLGGGNYSTPAGIFSLSDKDKLIQKEATGGLIAVIGDDNNDFVFIGASREFTATRDGALFLGINEGNLNDNSGSFEVTIEIDPGSGR